MSCLWKKVPKKSQWEHHMSNLDVTLVISLEAASWDHDRRYNLAVWYNKSEITQIHKKPGTYAKALPKYYLAKHHSSVKSVQDTVIKRVNQFQKLVWCHTVGSDQIDHTILQLSKHVTCVIDRTKFICYYASGASNFIHTSLAKLEHMETDIRSSEDLYKREMDIWDSMKPEYTHPTLEVRYGTRTETVKVKSGWRPGGWQVSNSDYSSDMVYREAYRAEPDQYETYEVPLYHTVPNPQYVPPPTKLSTLEEQQREFKEIIDHLNKQARHYYIKS